MILKIGVLGCASIAVRSVIPTIKELSEHYELIGIASRNYNTAFSYAQQFNCTGYEGYQKLLDESGCDAVYIPLPNSLHAEWIKKALQKGIHVLVEKSLACNYNDVVALNKLAQQHSLTLVENFQFRFHSQLQKIKELVNAGSIGQLRCMRSSFGFPPFPDHNNIRYKKELGGGALLDAAAYPIKVSQIFLGQQLTVQAANLFIDPQKQVDIWGGAYLKQTNGNLFSEIAFGFDNFYQCNIELWGNKGKLFTNRIFTAPANYQPIIELDTASEGKQQIVLPADNHFKNMLIHFYNLITTKSQLNNEEYVQNINQARLINELKTIAS